MKMGIFFQFLSKRMANPIDLPNFFVQKKSLNVTNSNNKVSWNIKYGTQFSTLEQNTRRNAAKYFLDPKGTICRRGLCTSYCCFSPSVNKIVTLINFDSFLLGRGFCIPETVILVRLNLIRSSITVFPPAPCSTDMIYCIFMP